MASRTFTVGARVVDWRRPAESGTVVCDLDVDITSLVRVRWDRGGTSIIYTGCLQHAATEARAA